MRPFCYRTVSSCFSKAKCTQMETEFALFFPESVSRFNGIGLRSISLCSIAFSDANRYPPSDQVRGHASLENAPEPRGKPRRRLKIARSPLRNFRMDSLDSPGRAAGLPGAQAKEACPQRRIASVSASTMLSTAHSISSGSSPSAVTRITGSVPDGRTISRPRSSRLVATEIASITLASSA